MVAGKKLRWGSCEGARLLCLQYVWQAVQGLSFALAIDLRVVPGHGFRIVPNDISCDGCASAGVLECARSVVPEAVEAEA